MNNTKHQVVIGDSTNMKELEDESAQLVVTSPPYFNAPFDYEGFYSNYEKYKERMDKSAREIFRVMDEGRIVCIVCDDMLVDGEKFPVVADLSRIFMEAGFDYRDKIIWKKPDGYVRFSRRSGVLLQNPYPMYFYPDNLQETILILQKGKFDYSTISEEVREESKINTDQFQEEGWYKTVWNITNVLPTQGRIEEDVAAFPPEIPRRLIKLFSYKGETVLDPYLGSGTTAKVALNLGRNSAGYEINKNFLSKIKQKLGVNSKDLFNEKTEFTVEVREDSIEYDPP